MDHALDMRINTLPAFTMNWLHMNEAAVNGVKIAGAGQVEKELPAALGEDVSAVPVFTDILSGAGKDMDALVEQSGVETTVYTVAAQKKIEDALRLHLNYQDQGKVYDMKQNKIKYGVVDTNTYDNPEGVLNSYAFRLEEGSELTVVMDYTSEEGARGLAGVQTKIRAEKDSVLRLIQIQRLGDEFTFLNDIGGVCAENARIEVIHLILSGKNTYEGCRIALEGKKSYASVDTGYQVVGNGHLDMNYDVYHTGKKTKCEMAASGVLRDNAFKLYRGTIDFQNGCAGAEGDEIEDVLLMDDTVANQTIPIILCAEEDVVGNHGATIGRIDEDLMFYMEARGMNREEIYEMMAKARIDAIIRKIPDAKTREMLSPADAEVEE